MQTLKFGLILVGALLAGSAQARFSCSSADGSVSYEFAQYFGGAAPPRDVSLTSEKWVIDGQEYVESVMLQNVVPAGLHVEWGESVKVGEPRTGQFIVEQDEKHHVTVATRDGTQLFDGDLNCTTYTWIGPPPP